MSVRHILCEKESKCLEALAKLEAGEKFNQVLRKRMISKKFLFLEMKICFLQFSVEVAEHFHEINVNFVFRWLSSTVKTKLDKEAILVGRLEDKW